MNMLNVILVSVLLLILDNAKTLVVSESCKFKKTTLTDF